jgi:hypothetical protein
MLTRLQPELEGLRAHANLEAQNAIDLMLAGVRSASRTRSISVQAASQFYSNGLSSFAHRCRLAKSTALQ